MLARGVNKKELATFFNYLPKEDGLFIICEDYWGNKPKFKVNDISVTKAEYKKIKNITNQFFEEDEFLEITCPNKGGI
jgi:hypothetical protein